MLARVLIHRPCPLQLSVLIKHRSSLFTGPLRSSYTRTIMSRNVSNQSDISKSQNEKDGEFRRKDAQFRDWITDDGKYTPEKGRYRLYVSYACPWATRTLIVRQLKGLEDIIPFTAVSPRMGTDGWPFASADDFPATDKDPLYDSKHVKDLYLRTAPKYDGRFTVPILWDTKHETIVNNESSEIIRMLYHGFDKLLPEDKQKLDYYPEAHRKEIDEINDWVYNQINNGVYKSGFATSQSAYESNVKTLFESLDCAEKLLEGKDYLVGNTLTEADIRLFPTIIRFDPVYVGHFKCNLKTIRDGYPNLHRWVRKLYWEVPAFKDTCNFEHIKTHYYWSHPQINPTRIVPLGPQPNVLSL